MSHPVASFVTLATKARMPALGLGTWQSTPEQVQTAVKAAVECGYRHIDTAWAYRNEKEIGVALTDLFKRGVVKREDMFITTKLHGQFHREAEVVEMLKDSLKNLNLEYVDLFLIHTPSAMKKGEALFLVENGQLAGDPVDHLETWKGMEAGLKAGLAKAIGLSNFNSVQIQRILDNCTVKPHNLQVECNGYWPQFELHDFCKKNGISFTAYAPIGSPGHASFNLLSYGQKGGENKTQVTEDVKKVEDKVLMKEPIVTGIAEKHNKTPAQVLLRWLIQREIVAIPKSITPARIKQNFDIWDFELTDDEMKQLGTLKFKRGFEQKIGANHPDYPFHIPF